MVRVAAKDYADRIARGLQEDGGVDSTVLHLDEDNGRVGIGVGNDSPTVPLDVSGDAVFSGGDFTVGGVNEWLTITESGDTAIKYASGTAMSVDSTTGQVRLPDGSASLCIGSGLDLRIYHDGSSSSIRNFTGHLYLETKTANDVRIRTGATPSNALVADGSTQMVTCAKGLTVNTTAASNALVVDDATGALVVEDELSLSSGTLVAYVDQLVGDLYVGTKASNKHVYLRAGNVVGFDVHGGNQMVTCHKGLTVDTTAASNALVVDDETANITLNAISVLTSGTIQKNGSKFTIRTTDENDLEFQTDGVPSLLVKGSTHRTQCNRGLTVYTTSDLAIPNATLVQNDVDEPFIEFTGTEAASSANSLSSWTSGGSINGFIRISVNGADRWIPTYSAPTS
jgi:hypothetical protein